MAKSLLRASTATFNVAISACEKGGQWQKALALANEVASSMRGDIVTFSAAMTACARKLHEKNPVVELLI